MPWCTVFVILSTVDSTDPSTVVAAPSIPADYHDHNHYLGGPVAQRPMRNYDHCETDDINAIDSSRTFLGKISGTHSSVHWLEYNNSEGNNSSATESDVKALNDAIRTPGAGVPPPVLDSNQQYYQMTQQAMQQQQYMQQPYGGWYGPPPPHMMPMPVMPMPPPSGEAPGTPGGNSVSDDKDKDGTKDEKDESHAADAAEYHQVSYDGPVHGNITYAFYTISLL